MLTYEDAAQMMKGARNKRRKLGNNTYLEPRGSFPIGQSTNGKHEYAPNYAIRLHRTDVVTLHPDGSQTLDSGGWRTVTTKDRINAHSIARVSSRDYVWYVYAPNGGTPEDGCLYNWDKPYLFADGMRVYPDGRIVGAEPAITKIRTVEQGRKGDWTAEFPELAKAYGEWEYLYNVANGHAEPRQGDSKEDVLRRWQAAQLDEKKKASVKGLYDAMRERYGF